MSISTLLAVALVTAPQSSPLAPRDPRSRALTLDDALFRIPEVTGRIVPVRDVDGDGTGDLVIARGGKRDGYDQVLRVSRFERIDLVSSRGGKLIRTLWQRPASQSALVVWDAGGDVDGDGFPDLLVALPAELAGRGRVVAISGRSGETKFELQGAAADDRLGTSIAFLGDNDGDGRDDFVVGAVQCDPGRPLSDRMPIGYSSRTGPSGKEEHYLVFSDGKVEKRSYWQSCLPRRSSSPGYVALRSGRDGSELWRVDGAMPGHGLGTYSCAVPDFDGDHRADVLVQCDLRSDLPIQVLSGASGKEIAHLGHRFGYAGSLGDLDGDGTPDLYLDVQDSDFSFRYGSVQIVNGKTHARLFELPYPDALDEYEVTVPLGDIDGDGVPDIALGGPNFNLLGPGSPGYEPGKDADLGRMSLAQALALQSDPWCAFTWESGCAIVYSGKAHEAVFGVWAAPGTRRGLGLEVSALPDVNSDGFPDIAVADRDTAYVFAGPGPAKK